MSSRRALEEVIADLTSGCLKLNENTRALALSLKGLRGFSRLEHRGLRT